MKKGKLHKIAPKLSEISSKSAFKVPKKYFKQVEDTLMFELKSKNFKAKQDEFSTPDGYFDQVEDLVITKLKATALQDKDQSSVILEDYFDKVEDSIIDQLNSKSKSFPLNKNILKYLVPVAVAASLMLIVVLNTKNDPVVTFDSLATSEIESFIDEGMIDIDAESLAMVFPDVDIENDGFESSLTNDEVLEYLNDTNLENLTFDN